MFTMVFDVQADRDTWYTKIKSALINAKASSPPYVIANFQKDEMDIADTSSEMV
jgi:hypothetical protein